MRYTCCMKIYNTYIFDLDGTLTDTMNVWLDILRDCLTYCDVPLPDDQTIMQHSHDWKQMLQVGLPEEKLDSFIAYAHKIANERLPGASMHVGAWEMLEALKNQKKNIAVFSTMDRPIFEPAFKRNSLDLFTSVAVAGTDVPRRKPHPDGILKALNDLGVAPEQYGTAVYIGDKDTDIQAANNAGVDAILYYPAAHQLFYDLDELKSHNPVAVITDWNQLLAG